MADQVTPSLRDSKQMVTIDIQLGQDASKNASFKIHKNIICHHSQFFAAAFSGPFQEGQTQKMTLTDITPEIFELFVHWLYVQNLDLTQTRFTPILFIQTWLLGNRFICPKFCNDVLRLYNELRHSEHAEHRHHEVASVQLYNYAYEHTHEGSPLRRYLASFAGCGVKLSKEWIKGVRREVLEDMFEWVKIGRGEKGGRTRDKICFYSEEDLKEFYV